jgi:hypothetical protein
MIPNSTTILRRFTGEWALLLQYDAVCIHSGLAMRSRLLPLWSGTVVRTATSP